MTTPEVQAAVERVTAELAKSATFAREADGKPLRTMINDADLTTILSALSEANERASILQTALHERTAERDEARKALAPPPPPKGEAITLTSNEGSSQGLGGHPCGERDVAETERTAALAGDAVGVIRRLVFRLEDLLEIARQWEPDHASGEHLAELFFAREARAAAHEFLSSGRYRQAGTGETFRDQPRLTALSDGALGRQDEVVQPIRDEPISSSKGEALPVVITDEMVERAARAACTFNGVNPDRTPLFECEQGWALKAGEMRAALMAALLSRGEG